MAASMATITSRAPAASAPIGRSSCRGGSAAAPVACPGVSSSACAAVRLPPARSGCASPSAAVPKSSVRPPPGHARALFA
eukprot:1821399-Pleurochrysis_carterae.AAC.1